ncbi:DUF2314 domain-containing protein [Chitinilyticum aquatile]|uniref:DUF2314 domain-containing protein n=1 Tax=Chitinilyticum aquatile TaxID=362520 RepID=UPI00042A18EF|nr:DUF2314 domain-containing protein [Chitinilyticum aquatile]
MTHRLISCLALLVLCLPGGQAFAALAARTPAGDPMAETIRFQFAVYYAPAPARPPLAALQQLAPRIDRNLQIVPALDKAPASPQVRARLEKDARQNYRPPGPEMLQYFGQSLSKAQAQALQGPAQALILDFSHGKAQVWSGLRNANLLVEQIARETGGLVWDEETREIYTPDAWHAKRLARWSEPVPDVATQTVIHAYRDTELVRAITLGMSKTGLPDVVMEDLGWAQNDSAGLLINLVCQTMAEGAVVGKNGQLDLDIRAIRSKSRREAALAAQGKKGESLARLTLLKAAPAEGDPDNRLLQISAARYAGPDTQARQEKMLSALFGSEDSVSYIKHNAALKAASAKARAELPALQRAFAAGLKPGEFILLKAPFATPDGGREWMWVEVTSWQGKTIKGVLNNEPVHVPELQSGQMVTIRQDEVFDYLRQLPDGTRTGNTTSKIIEQMQAR